MNTESVASTFNKYLLDMPDIQVWPTQDSFDFNGISVPYQLGGFKFYNSQFKNPTAGKDNLCFVSELTVKEIGGITNITCYVVETKEIVKTSEVRFFQVVISIDANSRIISDQSSITFYEKEKEKLSEIAPPIPSVPGPLGNVLNIADWSLKLADWISELLPDSWGGIGLALTQITEITALLITSAEDVDNNITDINLMRNNGLALYMSMAQTEDWEYTKYGTCIELFWNDEKLRIYKPLVLAESGSWTMMCKLDRVRPKIYQDDHLVVTLIADYDGDVSGVESAWKFHDAIPVESSFSKVSSKERHSIFHDWLNEVLAKLGTPLPKDIVYFFSNEYILKWFYIGAGLKLQEPNVPSKK